MVKQWLENYLYFLNVKERNILSVALDIIFVPIMFVAGGLKRDSIIWTHRWNLQKHVNPDLFEKTPELRIEGHKDSKLYHGLRYLQFHIPVLGGWKNYYIIKPKNNDIKNWKIAWKNCVGHRSFQMSKFKFNGPVKMLYGPYPVILYGFDKDDNQIELEKIHEGKLGDGKFRNVPLI